MAFSKMRFTFSAVTDSQDKTPISFLAALTVELGQCESFEHLAATLQAGLEGYGLEGCFLMSCFGFNRETRFGHWKSRYVFPLRSDLSEVRPMLVVRDNLIIVSSGYFTLVVGHANTLVETYPAIAESFLMLSESVRLWVKFYTAQVEQQFDSLNHRRASCAQLLEVVNQLDQSGKDLTSTHNRVVSELNNGVPSGMSQLMLTSAQASAVLDEFDELGRAYSIFTKQQMELNRRLKEQVRSIASFLLPREETP